MSTNISKARANLPKPLAVVLRAPGSAESMEASLRMKQELGAAGVAVYPTVEACASSVRKYLDWRANRP